MELIKSISADNGRFVANAHTLIKIAQVIMLFPFTGWLVKMTYLISTRRGSEGWLQRELSVKIHRRQSGVQPRHLQW